MYDINKFIDKETLKSSTRELWDEYLFERELESIERTILYAHARGLKSAVVLDPSQRAIEFLKEKDYTIVVMGPDIIEVCWF